MTQPEPPDAEPRAAAGWYPDPEDPAQLRYWDGSSWTEHRAPAHQPAAAPASAVAFVQGAPALYNVYDEAADLNRVLTPYQRDISSQHALTRFPTWAVVVLHFLTLGLFTLIYQGLKFSRLPLVKDNDFKAGKGIGFMFIPLFGYYWIFRFTLSLTDRLNFQLRLRGERPSISRGLALATCIAAVIPYADLVAFLILFPIVAGQWQAATNHIVDISRQPVDPAPPALSA